MIYLVLFWEFCKIGLLAIGGGLVTIPFLMELTDKYDWFSKQQLADMIAVSESTPGPIGVNMATYGGFNAAGIWGGLAATLGLVFPSLVVIVLISKYVMKYQSCLTFQNILLGIPLMRFSAPSRAVLSWPKMSTIPLLSTSVIVMVVRIVPS